MCLRHPGLSTTLIVLAGLSLGGCAKTETAYLNDLVPIKGQVTIDGAAKSFVTVTFHAIQGAAARTCQAVTDSAGRFSVATIPGGATEKEAKVFDGGLPGTYKVTFNCWQLPDGTPYDPITAKEGPMNVGAIDIIPPEYATPDRTPFEVVVPQGGKVNLDFPIKTK